ncbi:MAG: SulP family inorganic anion transporter, partial [Burkholderiales bacterium]|nr:SulP family inorganic anion transporter [Burkholderiales bacterium]
MTPPGSAARSTRAWPVADWGRQYRRADLGADVVAGLVTAILLVPQGMAFALLAGLPPQVGLYTSILPPIAYALTGSSRTLSVGPVSVAALMVAHAMASTPPGTDAVAGAVVLAAIAGGVLLAMGALRLGVVEAALSHPVLAGFTSAAALLIVLNQLPALAGVRWSGDPGALAAAFAQIGARPSTLLLGLACAALLVVLQGPVGRVVAALGLPPATAAHLRRAGPLAVVVMATLAAGQLPDAVAVVGAIPAGLPRPHWPDLPLSTLRALAAPAVVIGLVSYVESLSIAKVLAARRRERIDANQELIAIGAANLASAVAGGMPVAGGFSRTMVNFQAGARTPVASVVAAALVALVAVALTPVLEPVPRTALAAIIVVAVAKLIDWRGALAILRYDRVDAAVFALTAGGVLGIGIEQGIALGVAASLVGFAVRNARPHVAVVGRLRGSEHFRNVRRFDVETFPEVVFVRPDDNLTFLNAGFVETCLVDAV